jgi:hypothetical protein
MLFIDERTLAFGVTPAELFPLCAIANVLDSAKTVASVMIETFMVISPYARCRTIQIARYSTIQITQRDYVPSPQLPEMIKCFLLFAAIPELLPENFFTASFDNKSTSADRVPKGRALFTLPLT